MIQQQVERTTDDISNSLYQPCWILRLLSGQRRPVALGRAEKSRAEKKVVPKKSRAEKSRAEKKVVPRKSRAEEVVPKKKSCRKKVVPKLRSCHEIKVVP